VNSDTSFKLVFVGFFISLLLTLGIYFLGVGHYWSGLTLMSVILVLAGVQAVFQMIYFLHVGIESKPYWNLITFLFMVLVVVVVIGGSIWIMYNLNYNMMM